MSDKTVSAAKPAAKDKATATAKTAANEAERHKTGELPAKAAKAAKKK